jgi:hypothetical protein
MRNVIVSSVLLASMALIGGCVGADPERFDSVSQGVVPPPESCTSDELVTRTQGFWQNHSCVVKGEATGASLVPVSLGSLVFDKPADVEAYFKLAPRGGNTQIILGHQLLAAKLNVAAFGIGDFDFADWDGDGALETVAELIAIGDGLFDAGSSTERVKIATILDKLNNAGDNAPLYFDPTCNSAPSPCD